VSRGRFRRATRTWALASGIPVTGFDIGSLAELVPPEAGRLVPYGSDPYAMGMPDIRGLEDAAVQVLSGWERFLGAPGTWPSSASGSTSWSSGMFAPWIRSGKPLR
jgi:hypothetical protein